MDESTMSGWELRAGRDAGTRVSPAVDEEAPVRRKREDSDEELFFTPKSVRESNTKRRAVPLADSLGPPAKFEMGGSGARLAERASPRKSALPKFHSEEEMEQERHAAHTMRTTAPYQFDSALPLPNHAQFLLDLHVAVEQSVLVHMATSGAPASEWHDLETGRLLRIPNVITYTTLRPMVERTVRRSFTLTDFKRVVWIWSHAPGAAFTVPASPASTAAPDDVGGMGFVVSRVRTMDARTRRRTYDYGLGIEMRFGEKISIAPPVTFGSPDNNASPTLRRAPPSPRKLPPSPRSPSAREEMSNLAVWNNGVDERRTEFHRRLCHMVAKAHDQFLAHLDDDIPTHSKSPSTPKMSVGYRSAPGGILTPSATRSGGTHAQRIRHDGPPSSPPSSPLAGRGNHVDVPQTPPRTARRKVPTLYDWHADFDLESTEPIPQAKLPTLNVAPPVAPIRPREPPAPAVPTTTGMSLEERIRAKEQAMRDARQKPGGQAAAPTLHERALLSRLGEIADAIFLLYASSNAPAQSRQGRTSRVLPLHDVLSSLEKSAKVVMSRAESDASVSMLMNIAPGWLERAEIGGQTWLRLRNDPQSFGLRHVREHIAQAKRQARCDVV